LRLLLLDSVAPPSILLNGNKGMYLIDTKNMVSETNPAKDHLVDPRSEHDQSNYPAV
jgi:hypothetical protein